MPKRKKDKSRIKPTTAASSSPINTTGTTNPASSSATAASTSASPNQTHHSSFENVMEKYAISDKAFSKFKAKVDSGLIPKAVQSSLESMVDEVVKESVEGSVMSISMSSTTGGIVKEFTVMGNKLTPTVSVSLQVDSAGSGNGSQSGGKKRPRDCNSAFETKNCGEKGGAASINTNTNSNLDQQQQQQQLQMQQHQSQSYSFHSREEGEDDDEYSEEDYDEDEEDHVIGVCLHCGLEPPPAYSDSGTHDNSISSNTAPGIQVSCDDCHSFICSACHWCHEYQANHEIRVCDRCDAFYCKKCDEMDQCEDCGEVVCGGCGALCSCKFCGCGLCEDCATACGRCGIVLCQRDAKFAVECDTCKMSYCLVCLASGTKDPCVRCGHRTSKRVEQLVHLRLKSIYKAFKQSGAALDNNSKGDAKKRSGSDSHTAGMKDSIAGTREDIDNMPIPLGLPSGHAGDEKNRSCGIGNSPMNGDVGAVLQVAAAAAASAAASGKGSRCDSSSSSDGPFGGLPRGVHPSKVMPHLNHDGSISFRPRKEPKKNDSDKFASRTEAEANAAAAALLAELDEEKHQVEVSTTAKKSKKKKKKERHAAKEKEKEENTKKEAEERAVKLAQELKQFEAKSSNSINDSENAGKKRTKKKKGARMKAQVSPDDESLEDDLIRLAEAGGFEVRKTSTKTESANDQPREDDIESRLARLITANDLCGIEDVLSELKGVPGRAALRKNAKKASKRIREEQAAAEVDKKKKDISSRSATLLSSGSGDNIGGRLWKPTDPLIDFVKKSHRVKPTSGGAPRSECVMQLAPHVVGWVIGKGGQRIRDLMEDSGAKVWIDQDSMGAQYMRIVYVSGSEVSVNAAVKTIKDLVSSAPMPGTTAPSSTLPNVSNDSGSGSVASTRNSLTSTPVPTQKFANRKSRSSPVLRREVAEASNVEEPFSALSKPSNHSRTVSAPSSPQLYLSVPPPGMEIMLGTGSPPLNTSAMIDSQISSSPKVVHELFCEPRFVPLLIGRRGWTIKNIQDLSGARVDIDQKVIPRRIIISGNESQVKDAIRKVDEVLSYPHAQLNYSTTGPDGGEIDIGTLAAMQSGEMPSSFEEGIGEQSLFGLVRGQSLPLDYGPLPNNLPNGLMSQQPMQQPSTFAYGQQQSLPGHHPSPEQPFPSNIPSRASPVFLNRQGSAPLPEHNVALQMNSAMNSIGGNDGSFLRGTYSRDQQLPPHIMPLSSNHGNFENLAEGTNSIPMLGLGSDGGTLFPGHQQSNDDQALVNNIFGNPVPSSSRLSAPVDRESANVGADPLLQGFENLSFGESGNNDLAGWDWDGLMNDEGSSGRRVGLGGVRLDTSTVMFNNSDGTSNTNQWNI